MSSNKLTCPNFTIKIPRQPHNRRQPKAKVTRIQIFSLVILQCLRDRHQISLLISSELNNFFTSWNHLKTNGFLMISGGTESTQFVWIRLILAAKFGQDPIKNVLKASMRRFWQLTLVCICYYFSILPLVKCKKKGM